MIEVSMPAGRPVGTGKYKDGKVIEEEYKSSHPEKLIEFLKLGYLDCQVYAAFEISKKTFYSWIQEHEEFAKAHDIGLPFCEAWWIDWGQRGMRGEIRGFNFNAWIAFMNNKFKWAKGTYGDTNGSNVTNNVTISNMNVLQEKSKEGLIEYITRIGQKNQDVLNIEFIESSQPIEPQQD